MGGEVEYKWGLLSLLELPIGERHFELVALMLGILVCVEFCWELLNDILEHVRMRPAVPLTTSERGRWSEDSVTNGTSDDDDDTYSCSNATTPTSFA